MDRVQIFKNTVKQYRGKHLAKLRKKMGLKTAEMADLMELNRKTLYRYEKDEEKLLSFPVCCALSHIKYIYDINVDNDDNEVIDI